MQRLVAHNERLKMDYMAAQMDSQIEGAISENERLRLENDELRKDAQRYRWLRDRNDWYCEPRLDELDGTKWELVFYTPQRIEDPTDDDNLDAAVDAAIAADPEFGAA